jgi:aminoglycoside phosphotransferase family enzyme/predicted kinase
MADSAAVGQSGSMTRGQPKNVIRRFTESFSRVAVTTASPPLVRSLFKQSAYTHPIDRVELAETHISWVLLTGPFAYKIKKPVRLDFLDFSTLELRKQACVKELQLNCRFAPQVYLDVAPISGSPAAPRMGDASAPIEYAVKMTQFPSEARLDRVLAAGQFESQHCDALARMVAGIHRTAATATTETSFGTPAVVAKHVGDVLALAADQNRGGPLEQLVARIAAWSKNESARLTSTIVRRKAHGRVRDCHGDLHSENIVLLSGQPTAFDCLEFRDDLRWIDCASDLAFLTMDLADRGFAHFSHRLLNACIEQTGDIEALAVLRYYQVYRALVRAVVTTLQQPARTTGAVNDRAQIYLRLAEQYTDQRRPFVVITHGVSGTGKSTVTQHLLERLGAIRLRSDVERRRAEDGTLSDQPLTAEDSSAQYTVAARQAVYRAMLAKAEIALAARFPMIIDATFLRRNDRDAFRSLAAAQGVPFVILAFDADLATLRQRVASRLSSGRDVSEATLAVLDQQFAEREPLSDVERSHAIDVGRGDPDHVVKQLQRRLSPP